MDKALPDTVNHLVSLSRDRTRVLVLARSGVVPGVYYLWDRNEKSLDVVGEMQPGLPAGVVAPVEPVSYAARDGAVIPAWLTLPRGSRHEGLPAVVLPHTGARSMDTRLNWYLAQFLAARGYAVLQPNLSSPTRYVTRFAGAGPGRRVGRMQDDIADAARWLIAERIGDPNRMCIVGWSYGGYAAAMGAVRTPGLFRCAASINGVLDLHKFTRRVENFVRGPNGTPYAAGDSYETKAVSPYHQAERIEEPLLIVQAGDDAIVTGDQGRRMARRLQRLDKPVELVTVPEGGHAMMNEQARLQVLHALEAFLGRHIGHAGD